MAVNALSTSVTYAGNGATTVFPVPFKFFANGDLLVTTSPGGSLALGTNYTLSGAGVDAGGSLTLLGGALASGVSLTIKRVTSPTQPTSLPFGGPFDPSSVENGLDRNTMGIQESEARLATLEGEYTTISTTVATLQAGAVSVVNAVTVPEAYNAKGDGLTDDSAAFQAMLNDVANNGKSLRFKLTPGKAYRIVTPLTYVGNTDRAFIFEGDVGGTVGILTPRIFFDGTPGGTLLHLAKAWGVEFRGVNFDGNGKAAKLVHVDDDDLAGHSAPSATVRFKACGFFQLQQSGTPYGIAVGSTGVGLNGQASEVYVKDCYFRGSEASQSSYVGSAFKNLTAGNCKNFWLSHCQFYHFGTAIDINQSSGAVAEVSGCYFGDVSVGVNATASQVRVMSCGMENVNVTSGQFITGGTASVPTALLAHGNYCSFACPVATDYGIDFVGGAISLEGNDFRNTRNSSSVFKVRAQTPLLTSANGLASQRSSVRSIGNWYSNVVPPTGQLIAYAPIYDTGGSSLFGDQNGATNSGSLAMSWGDWGLPSDGVTPPTYLQPCMGYPSEVRANGWWAGLFSPGTMERSGQNREAVHVFTLSYSQLATLGAVTTASIQEGLQRKNWRVVSVHMDVVTPFAGPSLSAMTMSYGQTGTPTNLLLACNVMAAANTRYGNAGGDMGALFTGQAQAGGTAAVTADTNLVAGITSTGCNLSALTAGQVRFFVTTKAID